MSKSSGEGRTGPVYPFDTVAHGARLHWRVVYALATWAAVLVGATAPPAAASPALAERNRCLACHQVERKVVGPAFREIGRRYGAATGPAPAPGNPDMAAYLARRIRQGGSGAWGVVPMSANTHVSEDDARRLAEWILTLR